jgi:type II secretory pathway component PulF
MFKNLYLSAETSGNLDETMHRLFLHYQEESSRKLETISAMAPRVLYFFIVIGVAYQVISFYLGYFDMIKDAGGF